MKALDQNVGRMEKAGTFWTAGCNSMLNSWFLPDNQYRWGVNIVNRGGIPQTRPGNRLKLTLPEGNLQMLTSFKSTIDANIGDFLVFAVSGKVYQIIFNSDGTFTQPDNWENNRLENITFDSSAKFIYWAIAEQKITTQGEDLTITPTVSILVLQDGINQAAYWDGVTNRHLIEDEPPETPKGTWMAWAGNRLWVARGAYVLASDLGNPLTFSERVGTTGTSGDIVLPGICTGLVESNGTNNQSALLAFTNENTSSIAAYILNREQWALTNGFVSNVFPSIGCVAGKSIINQYGLTWWYSQGGLVSSDSAAAAYLTSQIKYRDIEMSQSKRNFAPDVTGICAASFENYLLISTPSGDTLNAHTWTLDNSIADQLNSEESPAWNGVWTGFRPVEWTAITVNGERRLFFASVDYQSLDGSFNHLWEAFQPERADIFDQTNSSGARETIYNPIYCSFETKILGDGLDKKKFAYAEFDGIEIGGNVNLKVSYRGTRGSYKEILNVRLVATLDDRDSTNATLNELYNLIGPFRVQSRRLRTQETYINTADALPGIEWPDTENIDKAFSLYFQWCGRFGVEALRLFMDPVEEESTGKCSIDETGPNIISIDGRTYDVSE